MDYIDVPSSVKDGAVRDWLMDESRLAFDDGCNVLSYSMIDSVKGDKETVSHHAAYITGYDKCGDCILEPTMPEGFLISGTYRADCPVRDNGFLTGNKGLVTIHTKDTTFIVVDNQVEYDEALKYTCVADRKVVQVDDNRPMSALEMASLTDTSNVDYCVVIHSDKYFDNVDEHVDRRSYDYGGAGYRPFENADFLKSDFCSKNKNFGMVFYEHNIELDFSPVNALHSPSLCVMPNNMLLNAIVVDNVRSTDDFLRRFPVALEEWKQDADHSYSRLAKSFNGRFLGREQFAKDVNAQYEEFSAAFKDVQKVYTLTSRYFSVCRGKEPDEFLVVDSPRDELLMSVSVSNFSNFSKAFSESLPYVDYDYLANDFADKDKKLFDFLGNREDVLNDCRQYMSDVKQRFEEADAVMKKIDSGELDMPVEYQLDGSRKPAERTLNKGR